METFYYYFFFTVGYLSCANERRWGGGGQQEVKNGQVFSVDVIAEAEGVGGGKGVAWGKEKQVTQEQEVLISGS